MLGGAATALAIGPDSPPSDRAAKRFSAPVRLAQQTPQPSPQETERRGRRRAGPAYYRRMVRKRVAPGRAVEFLPLYREAARRYGLNWLLLASIHRQETAFSAAWTTYHGLNAFGCCAGPMQFNVTNGPVSTWKLYREAFRVGRRPKRYPHRTRSHPSVYDDFDAIMAAGWLLSDSGAGRSLDYAAWWAAYSYYGHDLFGVTYASQVLARAVGWQRDGFCPNCPLDEALVEKFDDAYGKAVRRQLLGAERERKKHKKRKHRRDDKSERRERRRKRGDRDAKERARDRAAARDRRKTRQRAGNRAPADHEPPPAVPTPPSTPTTTTEPSTPPATTTPTPPPAGCSVIRRLLGCRP